MAAPMFSKFSSNFNVNLRKFVCSERLQTLKLCRSKSQKTVTGGGFRQLENNRLMRKFLEKRQKRGWYDVPTFITATADTQSGKTGNASRNPQNMKRVNNLSQLLHRHIVQIISSGELEPRLAELDVQISNVRLIPDFSGVNVFWVAAGTEVDEEVEQLLFKKASPLRQILMTDHLGQIPKINFVKDDHASKVAEIEKLLQFADMGEGEELDSEETVDVQKTNTDVPDLKQNVYGLDHTALMLKLQSGPRPQSDLGGIDFDPSEGSNRLRSSKVLRKIPSALRKRTLLHGDAREYFRTQQLDNVMQEVEEFETENELDKGV